MHYVGQEEEEEAGEAAAAAVVVAAAASQSVSQAGWMAGLAIVWSSLVQKHPQIIPAKKHYHDYL